MSLSRTCIGVSVMRVTVSELMLVSPCEHRPVPRPVPTRQSKPQVVRPERGEPASDVGFRLIGETGFEPATARPQPTDRGARYGRLRPQASPRPRPGPLK